MKRLNTDGRMYWMRMIDSAKSDRNAVVLEAEFASEVVIPGLLNYRNGSIVSRFTTVRPDTAGMYKYALRLRIPSSQPEAPWAEGTRKGYVFESGPIGELIALFSLSLQARLYHVATSSMQFADGVRLKAEFGAIRGHTGPQVDPLVFSETDRNFTDALPPLLDDLCAIPAKYHQRVVTAADHYGRALRYIGIDHEMVFVRLVSAVEAAAREQPIPGDIFDGITAEQLFRRDGLNEEQSEELSKIFETRKTKVRFVEFLARYSQGFFDREDREPPHTQVTPENLRQVATAIYAARSGYLHNGDPMFISPGVPHFPTWHMDAMHGVRRGDRKFVVAQKLPYVVFAHRLVRYCLLAYIRSLVPG